MTKNEIVSPCTGFKTNKLNSWKNNTQIGNVLSVSCSAFEH